MTTGYWVRGTTTNRTKVHLEADGKPLCNSRFSTRTTYHVCANGVHSRLVECQPCKRMAETFEMKGKPWLRKDEGGTT